MIVTDSKTVCCHCSIGSLFEQYESVLTLSVISENIHEVNFYTKTNYALIESIGYQLVKARNRVVSEMDAALREVGLNSHLMGVMILISRGEAVTPYELATQLSLDSGLMTRLLDKLEAKGLLKRVRNLEDRRIVDLKISETGKSVTDRIGEIAPSVLNSLLNGFTKSEFYELHRLLDKFLNK